MIAIISVTKDPTSFYSTLLTMEEDYENQIKSLKAELAELKAKAAKTDDSERMVTGKLVLQASPMLPPEEMLKEVAPIFQADPAFSREKYPMELTSVSVTRGEPRLRTEGFPPEITSVAQALEILSHDPNETHRILAFRYLEKAEVPVRVSKQTAIQEMQWQLRLLQSLQMKMRRQLTALDEDFQVLRVINEELRESQTHLQLELRWTKSVLSMTREARAEHWRGMMERYKASYTELKALKVVLERTLERNTELEAELSAREVSSLTMTLESE